MEGENGENVENVAPVVNANDQEDAVNAVVGALKDLQLDLAPAPSYTDRNVYEAARDGETSKLSLILGSLSEDPVDPLNRLFIEDGQSCTPLIIAARNGHYEVVNMVVTKYKADLEREGTVKFDGHVIEGATALWCAAGAGHLAIVMALVNHGADVNHVTKTNSTPLRAACFEGRLDIVMYLCDKKADLSIANKYNNTCLMIASYKGHKDVVDFLLAHGADPNTKALCGASALHFSAENGNVGIVRTLLHFGARMEANEHGMTPLMSASERCQATLVDYLITREDVGRVEKVEAMELLGASFANDKDNYDLGLAYTYLEKAMLERWNGEPLEKTHAGSSSISAYDNWVETRTVEELAAIANDSNAIHMEGLAIRERILGSNNPEVPHPVIFRGAVFADSARFDRCVQLWMHALHLRQGQQVSVSKDLLRFAQVLSQMLKVGLEVNGHDVKEVLAATVVEIGKNQKKIACPGPKDDPELIQDELENNMVTSLYLIMILTKVLKNSDEKVEFSAMKEIYELIHLNPTYRNGSTLLHLVVNQLTPVDDFHTNDVCRFPCANTTKLLIQAGADPQATDNARNTPLHIIVSYQKIVSDFLTLHAIIMALLEAGAHIDCVNSSGQTPLNAATTGVAEIILKSQTKMCLKCLAAKSIRKYNLTYQGQVPKALESFIQMHGP